MEEEDLILLAQEQGRQQQPLLQALNSVNAKLEKQHIRTNKSTRIVVDLTRAHSDEPQGLETLGITYLWLTIEKADSSFTYKLKQPSQQKSGIFIGSQGASFDQHEFTEIFVTNDAASGEAIIVVGWRE